MRISNKMTQCQRDIRRVGVRSYLVKPASVHLLIVLLLFGAAGANGQDESSIAAAQDGSELTLQEALEVPVPVVDPPPKLWEGRVEAGVNGAAGNTERL